MKINIKKLTETAILPERGSAFAAGYDLFADLQEAKESLMQAENELEMARANRLYLEKDLAL